MALLERGLVLTLMAYTRSSFIQVSISLMSRSAAAVLYVWRLEVGFPSLFNTVFGIQNLVSKNCVEPGDRVMEGVIEEEALNGTLRIKANGNWSQMSMVNTRGKLTSHTKILDMIINAIPLSK